MLAQQTHLNAITASLLLDNCMATAKNFAMAYIRGKLTLE
jgi:hypothetical protein